MTFTFLSKDVVPTRISPAFIVTFFNLHSKNAYSPMIFIELGSSTSTTSE